LVDPVSKTAELGRVEEDRVEIPSIILKSKAAEWLKKVGESI
jgi:hypothetical protein